MLKPLLGFAERSIASGAPQKLASSNALVEEVIALSWQFSPAKLRLSDVMAARAQFERVVAPSVFSVARPEGAGTGFAITNRHIATYAHGAESNQFRVQSTVSNYFTARPIYHDKRLDLIILEPTDKAIRLQPLMLAKNPPIRQERVAAVGYPAHSASQTLHERWAIMPGKYLGNSFRPIETDLTVKGHNLIIKNGTPIPDSAIHTHIGLFRSHSGASGSPVFNEATEVIGMNTASGRMSLNYRGRDLKPTIASMTRSADIAEIVRRLGLDQPKSSFFQSFKMFGRSS